MNLTLGSLIRLHYPGLVKVGEENNANVVLVSTWAEYRLKMEVDHGDRQGLVRRDFWLRYRLPEGMDYMGHAERVLQANATKIMKDAFYNARLQATGMYFDLHPEEEGPMTRAQGTSKVYHTEEQYREVMVPWMAHVPDAYAAWCRRWASEGFKVRSAKHRDNRGTTSGHTFGGGDYIQTATRLEAKLGREVNDFDVYIAGHRGPDPNNTMQFCSQTATDWMVKYGEEFVRRHGSEVDWRNQPFDADVVAASGGGKAHGRYALFDSLIDTRQMRARSSISTRRPIEQELELERMREQMRLRDEQQKEELRLRDKQQKAQMEYFNAFIRQQQEALQATFSQQGLSCQFPVFQPPPLLAPPPAPPLQALAQGCTGLGSFIHRQRVYLHLENRIHRRGVGLISRLEPGG